jgi:hypothetical protein
LIALVFCELYEEITVTITSKEENDNERGKIILHKNYLEFSEERDRETTPDRAPL